jgi:SAM-dependent methyltransferase
MICIPEWSTIRFESRYFLSELLRKRVFQMNKDLNHKDMENINKELEQKYKKVALNPRGLFPYPVGRDALQALGYDMNLVDRLDPSIPEFFCGVGNPFSLGKISPGERILDIGCGAGVDTLVAALLTGSSGKAAGIEMVESMYERACSNLSLSGLMNVRFFHGSATELPFEENSFDVIISNGVFNLITDRMQALCEAFRVLRRGGRFMIADQLSAGPENWEENGIHKDGTGQRGETVPGMDFLALMKRAGFINVEAIERRGFSNSVKIEAMHFRGNKPC